MSNNLAKKIGEKLKEILLEKGLTQEDAAKLCGLKYKYYQEIEGKNL